MKADAPTINLNRQLEAYAAVAKSPGQNARRRWGRWPIYAAATGAALAGASAASADIIYSGPQDISGFPGVPGVLAGVDGHAVSVFERWVTTHRIKGFCSTFFCFPSFNDINETAFALRSTNDAVAGFVGLKSAIPSVPPITSVFPLRFPTRPQTLFISHLETHAGYRFITSGGGDAGPKPFTRFLGVEMISRTSKGAIIPGSEKLGWIRVGFNQGTFPGTITIYGWAYNTDGPINAGEIAPGVYVPPLGVPEPSTLPVMLLAAGAAGVLAWKRRRQSTKA
jgi:PEP-CTERM motif